MEITGFLHQSHQLPKRMHMKKNPSLRTIVILCIILLIIYALADGIRYGSTWGIIMAVMSMLALTISISLYSKLRKLKEEEEEAS